MRYPASLAPLGLALALAACSRGPGPEGAESGALPPATLSGPEVVSSPDSPAPEALERAEAVSDAAAATTGSHADPVPAAATKEIAERERELALLRRQLVSQRHSLRQRRIPLDPALEAEVLAATTARPAATAPEARLAELEAAILEARTLSGELDALLS
ncbi:hypothetical protein [Oceanicella sp. SM1341]|uniref:hypothetical protein n=1 Tax=Oceanicella sp. SM1341 TaxID=1548889 RepID=UPI000E50E860|nr:hypothetical protein [Oceanicella sp. SM1341]